MQNHFKVEALFPSIIQQLLTFIHYLWRSSTCQPWGPPGTSHSTPPSPGALIALLIFVIAWMKTSLCRFPHIMLEACDLMPAAVMPDIAFVWRRPGARHVYKRRAAPSRVKARQTSPKSRRWRYELRENNSGASRNSQASLIQQEKHLNGLYTIIGI